MRINRHVRGESSLVTLRNTAPDARPMPMHVEAAVADDKLLHLLLVHQEFSLQHRPAFRPVGCADGPESKQRRTFRGKRVSRGNRFFWKEAEPGSTRQGTGIRHHLFYPGHTETSHEDHAQILPGIFHPGQLRRSPARRRRCCAGARNRFEPGRNAHSPTSGFFPCLSAARRSSTPGPRRCSPNMRSASTRPPGLARCLGTLPTRLRRGHPPHL